MSNIPAGAIPAEQFEAAQQEPSTDSVPPGAIPAEQFEVEQTKPSDPLSPLYAAAQGVSEGLIGPVAPWIAKKLGATPEQLRELPEAHPIAHGIGEMTGLGVGLMGGTGVGGLAVKAGEAIPVIKGAGYTAKVANSALKQAAEMAVIGSSDEAVKMLSDPNRSADTALSNIGLGSALGAGTGAFITGAVSPLWKASGASDKLSNALKTVAIDSKHGLESSTTDPQLRPVVKKALSLLGVKSEAMDEYLAHHAAVQKIPEFEAVYEKALDHIGGISDAVESSKMSVTEAKSAHKDLAKSMADELRIAGADAKTANDLAQKALKDGQAKLASDLLNKALGAGDKVAGAVDILHDKIVQGSAKAYDLLEKSGKTVDINGFINKAADLANELEAEGTSEARAQAGKIREYIALNQQHGFEIPAVKAKELIQGLDKVSKYDFNASTFDKGMSRAYKQLRYELDDTLKSAVPEYKSAMKPLAEDVQLISQLKRYGTMESATTRIKSLKNADVYKNEMPLLRQLEDSTGVKFIHELEPYANPDFRSNLMKAMPEHAAAEQTAADLANLKDPRTKINLEEMIKTSEEAKALTEAERAYVSAQEAKDALKGITSNNLQGKLKSVMTPGKNLIAEQVLAKFPGLEGKSIPEIMNLMRIAEAFDKNATRGSKHVNLYAVLGAALGHLLPGEGIAKLIAESAGIGGGGIAGAIIDNDGPKLVKNLLDKYVGMVQEASGGNANAAKAMLLKVLGHEGGVSAEGFKAGVEYMAAIQKGNSLINRSVSNVFRPERALLPSQMPNAIDRARLDKIVAKNEENDNKFNKVANSKLGDYLPEHHQAITTSIISQAKYLQSLKPNENSPGTLLDSPAEASPEQVARYNRAKDIAIQPLIVLQHIKDGTWQASDIQDMKAMYPSLYKQVSQQLIQEMIDTKSKGETIPYKTRLGLAAFLGQPLDNTMTPSSIMAAQPKPLQGLPQGAKAQGGKPKSASSLNKLSKGYQTPGQNAEQDRSGR